MREVLRGFRLKIKLIEAGAEAEIDRIMAKPTLSRENMQVMNGEIVGIVTKTMLEALREGVTFGQYVKSKINGKTKA